MSVWLVVVPQALAALRRMEPPLPPVLMVNVPSDRMTPNLRSPPVVVRL